MLVPLQPDVTPSLTDATMKDINDVPFTTSISDVPQTVFLPQEATLYTFEADPATDPVQPVKGIKLSTSGVQDIASFPPFDQVTIVFL